MLMHGQTCLNVGYEDVFVSKIVQPTTSYLRKAMN
jgi:hypothetical protein